MYGQALKLGLALGGGGVRGPAHLGVMRALSNAGVKVACIAGSSAGALIGTLYALEGLSPEFMAFLDRPADLRALYRDRLRLADSNPVGARIAERLRDARIEELPLPLAICAVDVWTREHVVLRHGPLLPALQASIAIPFVADPVLLDGRYLADGGRERYSALEAVRDLGADVVLEVLLHPPSRLELPAAVEKLARPFVDWLGQAPDDGAPRQRAMLRYTLDLAIRRKPRHRPSDILLRPATPRIPLLSPHGARRAYFAGYHAARGALPRLRTLLQGGPLTA